MRRGEATPVLKGKAADSDAAARVGGGSGSNYCEVAAGVVGDGEITRLRADYVGNDEYMRVGSGTAVASSGCDAPVVGTKSETGGQKNGQGKDGRSGHIIPNG
jgi:hypothetical protein